VVGASTEAIAGEGLILTSGALDAHVHFICPQLAREAIASGITTLFGGGTGPATGTKATTCTPGPNHIRYGGDLGRIFNNLLRIFIINHYPVIEIKNEVLNLIALPVLIIFFSFLFNEIILHSYKLGGSSYIVFTYRVLCIKHVTIKTPQSN